MSDTDNTITEVAENGNSVENTTNVLPLVSSSPNPVLEQSDSSIAYLAQSQSSATPNSTNKPSSAKDSISVDSKPNAPYFESDDNENVDIVEEFISNNINPKRRHKGSRSTTSLLSSIGNSIKHTLRNSPKLNNIMNNNINKNVNVQVQYTTTEETEENYGIEGTVSAESSMRVYQPQDEADHRRSTTTSLPSTLPETLYENSTVIPEPMSAIHTKSVEPKKTKVMDGKKKKKKKHRKSESKPIPGMGGLMSKLKQFQSRNTNKNKKKKKEMKETSPVHSNSRHKIVEVQPKPFQKKKGRQSKNKKTVDKASKRSKSKIKLSKHAKSVHETMEKYSGSSGSLAKKKKSSKLSKRHSMLPAKMPRKKSEKKIKSNYLPDDMSNNLLRDKKKKRNVGGSDISQIRSLHKKTLLKNRKSEIPAQTQLKSRKSEIVNDVPANARANSNKNDDSRSGRSSSNSKKKIVKTPTLTLTEEEEHELYIRKRDKYCKFRIKNEIFEIYDYYKPIRLCGSGAYAVVCEAIDTRTKKKVAIKKNKHIFDDIRDARRILREIKLLVHYQQCKHPDVIELYDTLPPAHNRIDDFDDVYCVMPLMETNLCKIITSKQPLTNLHYQYLTYQVLRGLKYIHSSGVIHRDIKPENILLNGSDCDVKIIDFGLARGVCLEEDEQKEARTEYVCTRWYRSPEVMCSGGHYDEKMDIWGVGCIMAEMILRNPLFPGQNYLDQLSKIFDVMGTPETVDWILNDQARAWVSKLQKHNGKDLRSMMQSKFDNEEDLNNCIDLLKKLLTLNPAERISASDSLLHPYFEDIHDEDECFNAPSFDLSFEFEKSIKTKFGVRHMMYEALKVFHNKKWAKIKKRKKKKKHRHKEQEKERRNNGSNINSSHSKSSANLNKSGKKL